MPAPHGAAIEVRLTRKTRCSNFQPSPGVLTEVRFPQDAARPGSIPAPKCRANYDPMLAKLIVKADTRAEAIAKLSQALGATRLCGISTNLEYLRQIAASAAFGAGRLSTRFLDGFAFVAPVIEVIEAGTYTTIQDYPGRVGYWDIGVPPSGPDGRLGLPHCQPAGRQSRVGSGHRSAPCKARPCASIVMPSLH